MRWKHAGAALLFRFIWADLFRPIQTTHFTVLSALPAQKNKRGFDDADVSMPITRVAASLPGGLTKIELFAFEGCESLTLTELPCDLLVIGSHAFFGCSLRRVRIRNELNLMCEEFSATRLLSLTSIDKGEYSD